MRRDVGEGGGVAGSCTALGDLQMSILWELPVCRDKAGFLTVEGRCLQGDTTTHFLNRLAVATMALCLCAPTQSLSPIHRKELKPLKRISIRMGQDLHGMQGAGWP